MHLVISPRFAFRILLACIVAVPLVAQQQQQPSSPASNVASSSSVMIVLDTSNHAKGSIRTLKHAAANMVQQFGSEHELGLITAGDKPKVAQDFTGDTSLVTQAIEKSRTGGSLALYEALAEAVQQLRSNAMNDRSAVIAYVSDLQRANKMPAGWQNSFRGTPAVPVYLIALRGGNWQTMEIAQQASAGSGGAVYAPTKNSELQRISNVIAARLGASAAKDSKVKANEPLRPLNHYTTLVVREIPVQQNNETAQLGGGENLLLERILVERLQQAKLFKEVWDGGSAPQPTALAKSDSAPTPVPATDAPAKEGTELEMLPMIVAFQPGNRRQRQFAFTAPFGGASRMRVQVILRDRATKETVATFTEQGSHSSGLFGGSDEKVQAEAMLAVANRIVDEIRRMKRERRK